MKRSRVIVRAILVPAVALAVLAAGLLAFWSDLSIDERAVAHALTTPARIGLGALVAIVLVGVLGLLAWTMLEPLDRAARRLAEAVRLIAHGNPSHRVVLEARELDDVAQAVNALADERSRLSADAEHAAAEAKAGVEQERTRLAALIGELDQAVLVCNRDGRVLLYNDAARALLGDAATESLGIGRSVFALLDGRVVLHAVEALESQLARDARESVHFVTATGDGRLLRARAASIVAGEAAGEVRQALAGYVLLLSDVTQLVEADATRAALFQELVEATRGALANIRAAIENLIDHPDLAAAQRARFVAIAHDESVRLSNRVHELAASLGERLAARWPLEDIVGEELVTLAQRRIERDAGLPTKVEAVERDLWLSVDSFSVAQGLCYLARRLKEEFAVREVRFRLTSSALNAQLDLMWRGPPLSSETAFAWQSDPFTTTGEDSPLTLADVMQRHGGEAWYQRDVPTQSAYFRLLLPLAARRGAPRARSAPASRPEFYDFDLFRHSPESDALDERRLDELTYTVLDCETTGLSPGEGDKIVAIGAVRIVNGRILAAEAFETLVDPERAISESATAVHGITPDMLRGQPRIEDALPRLRRFTEDTVLVGHNAAFDMRFLELSEATTGVRFNHPVLDTLLLSAVVHPAQSSHSLEEVAARLGVEVVGRHTAAGDARVTAEVFLRLLPLLSERGIATLGAARTASQRTLYARLAY